METIVSIITIFTGLVSSVIPIRIEMLNTEDIEKKRKLHNIQLFLTAIYIVSIIFLAFIPKLFTTNPDAAMPNSSSSSKDKDDALKHNIVSFVDNPFIGVENRKFDRMYQEWIEISEDEANSSDLYSTTVIFDAAKTGEDYVYLLSVPPYDIHLTLGVFEQPITVMLSAGRYNFSLATYEKHSKKILSSGEIIITRDGEYYIPVTDNQKSFCINYIICASIILFLITNIFRFVLHLKKQKESA